ncbi:hypothetical protein [Devosia sp. DBB001]|nr:hypothetical protein [Devosia sp. DBB001]
MTIENLVQNYPRTDLLRHCTTHSPCVTSLSGHRPGKALPFRIETANFPKRLDIVMKYNFLISGKTESGKNAGGASAGLEIHSK